MRYVTIVPFFFVIYVLLLAGAYKVFGLPGVVFGSVVLALLTP